MIYKVTEIFCMKDISSHLFIPQQEKHGLIGNGKRHNQYYKTPWKGGKEISLTGCIHSDNKRERKQDDRACFSMANTLIYNSIHITLQLDALYSVIWVILQRNLSHFAMQLESSYDVIWVKTQCNLSHITKQADMDYICLRQIFAYNYFDCLSLTRVLFILSSNNISG